MRQQISDEIINAYIDGELDGKEQLNIKRAALADNELQQQITSLKALKQDIADSYSNVVPQTVREKRAPWSASMVASVSLFTGIAAGWFAHWCVEPVNETMMGVTLQPVTQEQNKIILHVGTNDLELYQRAIEKVGQFLENEEFKRHQGQIELIANSTGVEFLLAEHNPYRNEIEQMMQNDNVRLIACMNSLRRVVNEGRSPDLIDGVQVHGPAVEQIVGRMQQGWTYLKI